MNEMTATNNGTTINCKSENSIAVVSYPEFVETSHRRDVFEDAASGDRKPTASGYREQAFPDGFKPYTEGRVEGEFG